MKKMLVTTGCCLLLIVALVIIKTSITYFFPQLENSKVLSYVLYFIFALGSICLIHHGVKK